MAKKRRRLRWWVLGGVVIAALIVWALAPREHRETVRVAKIERSAELKAIVNGSGEIRTKDSVDIQAEIAGVIVELPVREGDQVVRDQVLLKIDPFQTMTEVLSARATLSSLEADAKGQEFQIASAEANAARDEFLKKTAEVELRQAETSLAHTREQHGREKKLLEANLSSPDQFEVLETQLKLDQAKVEAAQSRIEQLESQIKAARANIEYARAASSSVSQRVEGARSLLKRADDLLNKTTIRSPLNGTIVKLNVEVGERAVPGIQSNPIATLMTIADLRIIEAELKVDETDIVNVEMDDVGEILVDALPEQHLTGRVTEIGNSPILSTSGSSGQEGKDFKVVLRLQDPPGTLRPGMSCEANITTDVRRDAMVVPIQALTMREVTVDAEGRYVPSRPEAKDAAARVAAAEEAPRETKKELQGVFVVGIDGRAQFRPVKTGILGEIDAEVLEGLSEGEEVIVGPLKVLRTIEENTAVTVDRTKPFQRYARTKGANVEEPEEES